MLEPEQRESVRVCVFVIGERELRIMRDRKKNSLSLSEMYKQPVRQLAQKTGRDTGRGLICVCGLNRGETPIGDI